MAILVQLIEGTPFNKYEITEEGITIGRSINNDIYLDDPSVSQRHVKIERKELTDGAFIYFIHDLKSTNCTFVNNIKVESQPLSDQDLIVIGASNFKFVDEINENLAQTKAFKKSWIPGVYFLED
jgi:pSer/pThr/pTyr-binding forkhead associated (FHA) protein